MRLQLRGVSHSAVPITTVGCDTHHPIAVELCEKAAAGVPEPVLAREYGISGETAYSYLRAGPTSETVTGVDMRIEPDPGTDI